MSIFEHLGPGVFIIHFSQINMSTIKMGELHHVQDIDISIIRFCRKSLKVRSGLSEVQALLLSKRIEERVFCSPSADRDIKVLETSVI